MIEPAGAPPLLMPAVELAKHLETLAADAEGTQPIDLLAIPVERLQAGRIHLQANLDEAWERFSTEALDALLVERVNAPGIARVYGVLTPEQVESAYRA